VFIFRFPPNLSTHSLPSPTDCCAPQEMLLDESSEIVQLHETKKGKTGKKTTRRSAFRVMTGAPRGKKNPMVS